jgi:hypothetical protein
MNGRLFCRTTFLAGATLLALCAGTTGAQSASLSAAANTALPPIESIGAGSDIRCFLAAGVPAELTRAALRRAWVADPKIRDFVSLSEDESFDRTAPEILRSEAQLSRVGSR